MSTEVFLDSSKAIADYIVKKQAEKASTRVVAPKTQKRKSSHKTREGSRKKAKPGSEQKDSDVIVAEPRENIPKKDVVTSSKAARESKKSGGSSLSKGKEKQPTEADFEDMIRLLPQFPNFYENMKKMMNHHQKLSESAEVKYNNMNREWKDRLSKSENSLQVKIEAYKVQVDEYSESTRKLKSENMDTKVEISALKVEIENQKASNVQLFKFGQEDRELLSKMKVKYPEYKQFAKEAGKVVSESEDENVISEDVEEDGEDVNTFSEELPLPTGVSQLEEGVENLEKEVPSTEDNPIEESIVKSSANLQSNLLTEVSQPSDSASGAAEHNEQVLP